MENIFESKVKTSSIFLTYAANDEDRAKILMKYLDKNNFEVLREGENIKIEGDYYTSVLNTLKNCDACILLFSRAAYKSIIVRAELGFASSNNKPIFGLRIDEALSDNFGHLFLQIHFIDWFNYNSSKPLEKLVNILKNRELHNII